MKELIKRFALFLLLLLLLCFGIDVAISKQIRAVYIVSGENELWKPIYDKTISDSCLIYGSSRAKMHIDPLIIEEVTGKTTFNFGNAGQSFNVIHLLHKKIVENIGYPKYVILSLDPLTLHKPSELFNEKQFIPYMLWDKDMIQHLGGIKGFSYSDFFIPLARYYGRSQYVSEGIKEYFHPHTFRERVKGYAAEDISWNDDFESAKAEFEDYPASIDKEIKDQFIEFVKECQQNRTKLALVYTPIHVLGQQFITDNDLVINTFDSIAKTYEIPFIDYTRDPICHNQEMFYNSMHLNRKGSIIISERIARDLKNIGFFE